MELKKEEVLHVAKLARISLSDEEVALFQTQLSDVLSYVDQLQEVDTQGIEETAQVTGLVNKFRSDEVKACDEETKQATLDQAPDVQANLVKVKSVFK